MRPLTRMLVLSLLLLGIAFPAAAPRTYIIFQAVTGAIAVVSVSSDPNTNVYGNFIAAAVSCSGGCNLTEEVNATLPTATQAAPAQIAGPSAPPQLRAFTASNAASSGVVTHPYPVQAGILMGIDLSPTQFVPRSAVRQTLTLRTDSATGTNGITVIWSEPTQ